MKKTTCLLLLLLLVLVLPKNALASGFSVGIYPPLSKVNTQTPITVDIPFAIQNYDQNDSVDLNLQVRPFIASNSFDGQAEIVSETTKLNASYENLLRNTKILDSTQQISTLTLSPTQRKQLTLEIDIPKDTPLGDYYFSVIAKSKASSLDQTNLSSIVAGVATNIILTIGKTERVTGVIQDFSTPLFFFNGPVPISLLVENTGKNVFAPNGNVVVRNMFGQIVGAKELLPVDVLSHSSRFIPDSNSDSKTQIIWGENTIFGVYQVTLNLALSPEGPLFKRTIYFLAIPVKTLIIFIFSIIILVLVLTKVLSKLKSEN